VSPPLAVGALLLAVEALSHPHSPAPARTVAVTFDDLPATAAGVVGRLNADRFDALAEALKQRGYTFVTVARALEDPVYRLRDEFVGAPSNSWFNHWEITAGRAPVPTPPPPDWISRRQ
jgi:hypothetical protein